MRAANQLAVLAVACAALVAAPTAGAARSQPTPKQITAAVHRASQSKLVWATFNSCDDRGDQTVGIRGEMPALTFPAHLLMVVTVEEFSATAHRYVPIAGRWKLGGQVFTGGAVVQEGLRLKFGAAVTLIARIDFEWFANGKLLGSTQRTTRAGHPDAHGQPAGYSVASCTL